MQLSKTDLAGKFWNVLGDIKVSKMPFFMIYRPRSFALKGSHTREVMKLVKPGDILVRSFNHYLNNYFMPGTFKHVGFYLSEVNEQHLKQFAHVEHLTEFKTGRQMVIHSIGNQIFLEDLIDFCRCDGLAIMRFPHQLKSLHKREIPFLLQEYFADPTGANKTSEKELMAESEDNAKNKQEESTPATEPVKLDPTTVAIVKAEKDIAEHIAHGKVVEFEKIFKILYRIAIRELTTPHNYDFGIEPFSATACTEFVYFITKSLCWNYGIEPELSKVFFKQRPIILPDAFVDNDLEEVWKSDII